MATENYSIGLQYEVNEAGNYCTVTGIGTCTDTEIVIPDTYEGYAVREIGQDAFRGCTNLTSVTIPDSVTSISSDAFAYCRTLTSVTIPNNVTSIGKDAFSNCSGLTSITIGNSVTSIGQSAFYNTAYYNDNSNWENEVLYIGKYLIKAKTDITGAYTVKEGTKLIADNAFYDCSDLTSITIPDSVTSIGNWAFSGCYRLSDTTIPNSVVEISGRAFWNCDSLTSVTIPDSVTSIGNFAFSGCDSLTSVTIGTSVTSIGYEAFYDTAYYKNSSNWENEVLYIGKYLIAAKTDITGAYTVKEGTKLIADNAFENCINLTSITIPNSVRNIGDEAFEGCTQLQTITLDHPVNALEGAVWGAPEDVQVAWIGATGSENVEFYFLNDVDEPCPYHGAISFGVEVVADSAGNAVSVGDDGVLYVTDTTGPHTVGTFDAAKIRFKDALAFTENFGKYKPNGVLTTYDETKGMSVQQFITSALTNYSIKSYPRLTASISPSSARYGTTQNYNLRLTFTQGEYSTGDSSRCEVESIVIDGGNKLPSSYKEYIDGLTENGSTTIPLEAVSLLDDLSYNCTVTYTADKTGGVVEGVRIPRGTATATTSISCYDGWIICPTTNTYNTYTDDDIASIISEAAMKTTNDNRVDSYEISTSWKNLYVLVPTSTVITNWNPIDATNNSPLGNLYSENVSVAGGKNYDNYSETIEYKLFSASNAIEYNACTINFNWSNIERS